MSTGPVRSLLRISSAWGRMGFTDATDNCIGPLRGVHATREKSREPVMAARSHLSLVHTVLEQTVQKGDTVIDATCGNGHDSCLLAERALNKDAGKLYCLDIQTVAIENTKAVLRRMLRATHPPEVAEEIFRDRIALLQQSHSSFPTDIAPGSVAAIVYNLGYLPGAADKSIRTREECSVLSIRKSCELIQVRGVVCITAYRGHPGGLEEAKAVEALVASLPPFIWSVYGHSPLNRPLAPVVYTLFRNF